MIAIKRISEVKYDDYEETWGIVRSLKNPNPRIKQVATLSPSWDLFKRYRSLAAEGNWNENTFRDIYVPQFLKEMTSNDAKQLLNELYRKDKEGRRICLFCFCTDETLCHRSIIAGLLQGTGVNVVGVKGDYSRYFHMWKEINAAQK